MKRRADGVDILILVALLLFATSIVFPFLYIFSASMSDPKAIYQGRVWIFPQDFNADDINFFSSGGLTDNLDRRSPEKGPEPESVVVGKIGVKTYAFIGLERIGGVMVYDVTNPLAPIFQSYFNNRDFDVLSTAAGDLGIEGLVFISANDSPDPDNIPLLVTANKVSGTTTIFGVVQP